MPSLVILVPIHTPALNPFVVPPGIFKPAFINAYEARFLMTGACCLIIDLPGFDMFSHCYHGGDHNIFFVLF
jgi:hypothetical protein